MRYVLALIILMHGLIHFLGFAKAFGYGNITQLTNSISRPLGLLWLLAGVLFVLTSIVFLMKINWWWAVGTVAVILSQILIITAWQDAWFGTIANLVLLLVFIVGFGTWGFSHQYQEDVTRHLMKTDPLSTAVLTEADISPLPAPVQQYIRYSGAVGKPLVKNFRVEFTGNIRSNETSPWMPFYAEQYSFLTTPTRLFFMDAVMKRLPVAGYHAYRNGVASMDIRLLSLFNVQYASGKEMGEAETVTFFNDMCLLAPGSLIDPRISWRAVEDHKVQASFTTADITVSAWLYFNEEGQLTNFVSEDRYALGDEGSMKKVPWSTPVSNYQEINGMRLPTYGEAIYHYPDRDLRYITLNIQNVEYNRSNVR